MARVFEPDGVFQFTPLREGRPLYFCPDTKEFLISIHAPPRGATDCGNWWCMSPVYFNSRPSARGDTKQQEKPIDGQIFQFTPLREGRRNVSTVSYPDVLFQFTPLREGRLQVAEARAKVRQNFNSRPSARGDGKRPNLRRTCALISIHAPPRGATLPLPFSSFFGVNFNSRPSARGDESNLSQKGAAWVFQFTPLREGRRT